MKDFLLGALIMILALRWRESRRRRVTVQEMAAVGRAHRSATRVAMGQADDE